MAQKKKLRENIPAVTIIYRSNNWAASNEVWLNVPTHFMITYSVSKFNLNCTSAVIEKYPEKSLEIKKSDLNVSND